MEQDPIAGVVVKTLNDLSQGEFDIVIADVEASITQRQAQMFSLLDAVQRLSVPGDIVFDIVLELSDIPNKEEIKQRWQQRQESQAKAAQEEMQMKLQIEEIKNQDSRIQIQFKDAPFPIQLAMAAKAGLVDSKIAQYAVDQMINQMYPQLAQQQDEMQAHQEQLQQQGEIPTSENQQQLLQEDFDKMLALSQMTNTTPQRQNNAPLTQAAVESVMRGITPAM